MKHQQREETIKGNSPWVDVDLNRDGTEARVKVRYHRQSRAKDVQTDTWGTLDLGWLGLEDLACVGRTVAARLNEAQQLHIKRTEDLMRSVARQLNV